MPTEPNDVVTCKVNLDGTKLFVLRWYKLFVSFDNGETWTEVTNLPEVPEQIIVPGNPTITWNHLWKSMDASDDGKKLIAAIKAFAVIGD